jgi:hypothetical protein
VADRVVPRDDDLFALGDDAGERRFVQILKKIDLLQNLEMTRHGLLSPSLLWLISRQDWASELAKSTLKCLRRGVA